MIKLTQAQIGEQTSCTVCGVKNNYMHFDGHKLYCADHMPVGEVWLVPLHVQQAQIEAVLAEFEDELTAKQRSLIADQIYRITAAAQVGERPLNVLTGFQGEMLDAERKRVAAQEIETIPEVIAKYRKKEIDATIECCAQVAEAHGDEEVGGWIADAIRELKDKK